MRSGWNIPTDKWNDTLTMVKNLVFNAPDIDSGIASDFIPGTLC